MIIYMENSDTEHPDNIHLIMDNYDTSHSDNILLIMDNPDNSNKDHSENILLIMQLLNIKRTLFLIKSDIVLRL